MKLRKIGSLLLSAVMILALSCTALALGPGDGGPGGGFGGPGGPGGDTEYYTVSSDPIAVDAGKTYTIALEIAESWKWAVESGADVTGWFVQANGAAAFTAEAGAATAGLSEDGKTLNIALNAARVGSFRFNGSADLYIKPASSAILPEEGPAGRMNIQTKQVGSVQIPTIRVEGEVYGSGYSNGASTVVGDPGKSMTFTKGATLVLEMDGLDSKLINSGNAILEIVPGDGYAMGDYTLTRTKLRGSWSSGRLTYTMSQGDLQWDGSSYTDGSLPDGSALSFSCFGGDGSGNYYISLAVSGITYNGLPVASQKIPVHLYAYGRSATDLAELNFKTLFPAWSWEGEGDMPILCDNYEDDFIIRWPTAMDASKLTAEDFTVTLESQYGDKKALTAGTDYVLNMAAPGKTELAVRYENWAFTPVYTTMTISVKDENLSYDRDNYNVTGLTKTWDIASVYAYSIQSGGSGGKDHGVTFTYYGVKLDSWEQVQIPMVYRLTTADGQYYAEDENGVGSLVANEAQAKVYEGTGPEDYNYQLLNDHIVAMTERNEPQTVSKTVDGKTVTLTKVYASGMPEVVANAISVDPYGSIEPIKAGIQTLPGYVIGRNPYDTMGMGETTWLAKGMWPWLPAFNVGWIADEA